MLIKRGKTVYVEEKIEGCTAQPQDVKANKIFYNDSGEQLGSAIIHPNGESSSVTGSSYDGSNIYLPVQSDGFYDVGHKLSATNQDVASAINLNPDDIVSGKTILGVTGTAKAIKKVLFPQIKGTYIKGSSKKGFCYRSSDGYTFTLYDADYGNAWGNYYTKIEGIDHIIGVEIDGHYSFCPSAGGNVVTIYGIINNDTSHTYESWFYYVGRTIYLTANPNGDKLSGYRNRQITIHYMDK